jgi:hypothetical protein
MLTRQAVTDAQCFVRLQAAAVQIGMDASSGGRGHPSLQSSLVSGPSPGASRPEDSSVNWQQQAALQPPAAATGGGYNSAQQQQYMSPSMRQGTPAIGLPGALDGYQGHSPAQRLEAAAAAEAGGWHSAEGGSSCQGQFAEVNPSAAVRTPAIGGGSTPPGHWLQQRGRVGANAVMLGAGPAGTAAAAEGQREVLGSMLRGQEAGGRQVGAAGVHLSAGVTCRLCKKCVNDVWDHHLCCCSWWIKTSTHKFMRCTTCSWPSSAPLPYA